MTIVAGFVNDQGVLMCSDTLVGDGIQSSYRSKIIGVPFVDGKALFGYAGEMVFSESAIQRCADVLRRYNGNERDLSTIIDSIREPWAQSYRQSHGKDTTYDQIIASIFSTAENDVALYHSANHAIAQSYSSFECIGCGDVVCKHILGGSPLCGRGVDLERVFECAIRACSHVKAAMPTAVGGNLVAVNLGRDGVVKVYAKQEIEWIEQYTLKFDELARMLFLSFTAFRDNDVMFDQTLDYFRQQLCVLRAEWKTARSGYPSGKFGFPPPEIMNMWNTFRKGALAARKVPKCAP